MIIRPQIAGRQKVDGDIDIEAAAVGRAANGDRVILSTAEQRRALLARSRTIAVVGASPDADRPSAGVFACLNVRASDIVDVFRKRLLAAHVARAAVAIGARAVWFQVGVADDEAHRSNFR